MTKLDGPECGTMNASLLSSQDMGWQTPDGVLDLVRAVGPIVLDPASTEDNPCGALTFYTPDSDGLAHAWTRDGLVYVNPPYGQALKWWSAKIAAEMVFGSEVIALVPSRTDTRWFHTIRSSAVSACFWAGRLTFKGAPAPAPFPSVLFYAGPNVNRFRDVFGSKGWVL